MIFVFIALGQVSIALDNCKRSILFECGVWPLRATPAASTLFDIHDVLKATYEEVKFFRAFVTKLFYIV